MWPAGNQICPEFVSWTLLARTSSTSIGIREVGQGVTKKIPTLPTCSPILKILTAKTHFESIVKTGTLFGRPLMFHVLGVINMSLQL